MTSFTLQLGREHKTVKSQSQQGSIVFVLVSEHANLSHGPTLHDKTKWLQDSKNLTAGFAHSVLKTFQG